MTTSITAELGSSYLSHPHVPPARIHPYPKRARDRSSAMPRVSDPAPSDQIGLRRVEEDLCYADFFRAAPVAVEFNASALATAGIAS